MTVAISGLGRIGRLVLRQCTEHGIPVTELFDPVMTRDDLVYLLRHDSLYSAPAYEIHPGSDPRRLHIAGTDCRITTGTGFEDWLQAIQPDILMECSGRQPHIATWRQAVQSETFTGRHLVSTWLCGDTDAIWIPGATPEPEHHPGSVISAGTCTGNCVLPVLKILQDTWRIDGGFITILHPYLAAQNLLDNPHRGADVSFARAATMSVIPARTRILETMDAVFPGRAADFNAICHRIPIPAVMTVELNLVFRDAVRLPEVINRMEQAAATTHRGILNVVRERLVSRDFVQTPWSASADAFDLPDAPGRYQKILLWQDNEWGYCCRVTDIIRKLTPAPSPGSSR